MSKAQNKVVAGDYISKPVIEAWGTVAISVSFSESVILNKNTIENIEIMDKATNKDAGSAIARGIVGGVLLGPLGLVGGALLGKNSDINTLSVIFKDGKRSMIEVDGKIYKELQKKMY